MNMNLAGRLQSTLSHQEKICCTYCIQSPVPAVKSCLHCEASLCDNHLRTHSKEAKHVLIDPSTSLENRKCSIHKEPLKYYCTKDATCICVSCSVAGEHRGHKVEMLDEASEKKKEKLRKVLQKLVTERKKTEERVQSLKERRRKASGEAKRATALFIDIRRRLDDLEKRVLSEISKQEEQMSRSLSDIFEELEIKKDDLSRRIRHIEGLCNMMDPLTVLRNPDPGDLYDFKKDTEGHEKTHDVDVDVITGMLHDGFSDIKTYLQTVFPLKLKRKRPPTQSDKRRSAGGEGTSAETGGIYGEGPADILLDVNTAANIIHISNDLKTASRTEIIQNRPGTAERFQYHQVMSSRGFSSGQHYWDVEIIRSGGWMVGMCYPSIDRRGDQSIIGDNNKSWGLWGGEVYNNQYSVKHGCKKILLPQNISSNRVRICLDYDFGQLSFYELCDPIRHLYTFTATFTEPLHAALYVYKGSIRILGGGAAGRN